MALSLLLGEAKLVAEQMDTKAEVSLEKIDDGFSITSVHLTLRAKIRNVNREKFAELADKAKSGCPVSKLMKAPITLDAALVD
jgi:osmotically inducible protein OsmC